MIKDYVYIYICVCESIEYSLFMHVCAIVIILNLLANRPRIETRPSTERLRGQNLQGLDPEPRRRCRRGRTKNCPKWRPTACSPPQKNRLKWWAYVDLEKSELWNYEYSHGYTHYSHTNTGVLLGFFLSVWFTKFYWGVTGPSYPTRRSSSIHGSALAGSTESPGSWPWQSKCPKIDGLESTWHKLRISPNL